MPVTVESLPIQHCISYVLYKLDQVIYSFFCLYFLRQSQKWLWMQSSWMSIKTAMAS